jgi:formate dehydrogenase assembly factor FdhD
MEQREIIKYSKGVKQVVQDKIAEEHIIKLFINEKETLSFATYPLNLDELIIGFLFSEGIISSLEDVIDYEYQKKNKEYHPPARRIITNSFPIVYPEEYKSALQIDVDVSYFFFLKLFNSYWERVSL